MRRQGLIAVLCLSALAGATPADVPDASPRFADPPVPGQRYIYFPPQTFSDVRRMQVGSLILLTNTAVPDASLRREGQALLAFLHALPLASRSAPPAAKLPTSQPASQLAKPSGEPGNHPASRPADRPITAALYATAEGYRNLWRRVGVYYNGEIIGADPAGGYSYRVFCATYLDPAKPKEVPPELAHELTHVWLWQHAGLPNDGNWLTEGLAMAAEVRLHPTAANRAQWRQRVQAGKYLPLLRLMARKPIPADAYWQACTLAETLLGRHPKALPALIGAVRRGAMPYTIITDVLATDSVTLEKQWRDEVLSPAASESSSQPAR